MNCSFAASHDWAPNPAQQRLRPHWVDRSTPLLLNWPLYTLFPSCIVWRKTLGDMCQPSPSSCESRIILLLTTGRVYLSWSIHVNAPECHENLNLENREGKTHLPKRAFQRCKKTLDVNSVPSVSLCVPWIYSVFWMFQNELPEEKKPRNTQTSSWVIMNFTTHSPLKHLLDIYTCQALSQTLGCGCEAHTFPGPFQQDK